MVNAQILFKTNVDFLKTLFIRKLEQNVLRNLSLRLIKLLNIDRKIPLTCRINCVGSIRGYAPVS